MHSTMATATERWTGAIPTGGRGAGNRQAHDNYDFPREINGQSSLRLPAVRAGLVGSQPHSCAKHEFARGLGTEFGHKTEERHRRIGCTDTTGRLPDHL